MGIILSGAGICGSNQCSWLLSITNVLFVYFSHLNWQEKSFYLCLVLTQCRVALRLPGECRARSPLALDNLPLHQLGTGSLFWCVCAAPWARWGHSTPWSKLTIQTTQSHRSLWS